MCSKIFLSLNALLNEGNLTLSAKSVLEEKSLTCISSVLKMDTCAELLPDLRNIKHLVVYW